jgi:hypothetical protein
MSLNVWSADERDTAGGLLMFIATNVISPGPLTPEMVDDFFELGNRQMGVFWSEQFELGPEVMFA